MTIEKVWKPTFNIGAVIAGILFIKYSTNNNVFWGIFWFVVVWVAKLLAEYGYDWFERNFL